MDNNLWTMILVKNQLMFWHRLKLLIIQEEAIKALLVNKSRTKLWIYIIAMGWRKIMRNLRKKRHRKCIIGVDMLVICRICKIRMLTKKKLKNLNKRKNKIYSKNWANSISKFLVSYCNQLRQFSKSKKNLYKIQSKIKDLKQWK